MGDSSVLADLMTEVAVLAAREGQLAAVSVGSPDFVTHSARLAAFSDVVNLIGKHIDNPE